MSPIRIAVIGAGVMGANHARVARQLDHARLVAVVDPDLDRARALAAGSDAQTVTDIDQIVGDIDLAIIAVPTALHAGLALRLIDRGVHLLIEKPIAASVADAEKIIAAADEAGLTLAVGHIERFNAAVSELPNLIDEVIHVKATRVSPYSPRISDGVVHDLMIHDIDIVLSLLPADVEAVAVGGTSRRFHGESDDLANAHVCFANGVTAAFETSRLGQNKVRQVEITQADSVIIADLLRQDVTIHRMSRNEYLADDGVRYRQSSVVEIPYLDQRGEPLMRELDDVIDSVVNRRPPRVDGRAGVRALALADRISDALVRN